MASHVRSLLGFLKTARKAHMDYMLSASLPSPIYVVGNPSADLDSIISAIVYSYFAHNASHLTPPRAHIPLINLENVSSGPEMKRLRPEFVEALWLCTGKRGNECWENTPESAGDVLKEHIVTVQDFRNDLGIPGSQKGFRRMRGSDIDKDTDAILVDWNDLPNRTGRGQGSMLGIYHVIFHALGCIDHHVDEGFMPSPDAIAPNQPLLIKPAGSCTSLVVNALRERGLWNQDNGEGQVAQLALASILMDTANLTAKDKVTDSDIEAFNFLSPKINNNNNNDPHTTQSDIIKQYYNQIHASKQSSLDLLTIPEILVRDYKAWEVPRQPDSDFPKKCFKLGFCSAVRPLSWIVHKAGTSQALLHALNKEVEIDIYDLDVVALMTTFTSPARQSGENEQFRRELLVCATHDRAGPIVDAFIERASSELGLMDWKLLDDGGDAELQEDVKKTFNNDEPRRRVWIQTNVAKSRKQVAPLMREAARL